MRVIRLSCAAFCRMWAAGTPTAEIAAHFGISATTVAKVARDFDLPRRKVGRPTKITPEAAELIAELWPTKVSTLEISAVTNVPPRTIWSHCTRAGYPHRRRGHSCRMTLAEYRGAQA